MTSSITRLPLRRVAFAAGLVAGGTGLAAVLVAALLLASISTW